MVNKSEADIAVINIFGNSEKPAVSCGSLNIIQSRDLAKMMAVNRKSDGQCEQLRAAKKSP